jgi:hypothetical protein
MRTSRSWIVLLALPMAPFVGAAALDGCTAQNDSADGGDNAGCTGDRCVCAMTSPALNRECRPTRPCPSELDCIYQEGCADPKGKCLPWGRCPDSADGLPPICGCDGVERQTRTEPFPVDPRNDTGGAPCPKDGGRD